MKNLVWIGINEQPAPIDVPVLVWLEAPSLGRYLHSAEFNKKGVSIIGHHFAWDMPIPTHWTHALTGPNGEPAGKQE
jgi:hypothetical protein